MLLLRSGWLRRICIERPAGCASLGYWGRGGRLPRRLDFRTLTQADLDTIAQQLNERPRQTLAFNTPSQALAELLR
jgi:hypothetical protein